MELRSRAILHLDRVMSRIERHVPGFLQNGLAADLDAALLRSPEKTEFMEFMDSFQQRLFQRLLRKYEVEPFCQLLALKLCNLAVARYHFMNRHAVLASGPFQLTVDTTNACQLACPGCVHTSNRAYADLFDWPRRTLPADTYDRFLEHAGPFSFCATIYNYGEPLLHKRFPDFVRSSKKYLMFAMTSTNLSMPMIDAEGIVRSGLDRMVLSIDGTTQDVYARYRRKGNLELVFDNVQKLVAAKKRLGSPTPYLVWQFLTFEHNAHQAHNAIRKAQTLGINEIMINTPFGVELDDPGIRPVVAPDRGTTRLIPWDGRWCSAERRHGVEEIADQVAAVFRNSWAGRLARNTAALEGHMPASPVCAWLYQNLTIDGAARLMPCCMAPDKQEKHLVFANFTDSSSDSLQEMVNSPMARLARLSFGNREAYEDAIRDVAAEKRPFCASCKENPSPYGLANVASDIRNLDVRNAVPRQVQWALTCWS